MREQRFVRERSDWMGVAEALHHPEPNEARWAEAVVDAARPMFPRATVVGMYSIKYATDFSKLETIVDISRAFTGMEESWRRRFAPLGELGTQFFRAMMRSFHFTPAPVMTSREIAATFDSRMSSMLGELRVDAELGKDGIGIVTHPAPGRVTVLHTLVDGNVTLRSHERHLLTRVALHLETASRARSRPEAILGELTSDGRVLWRDDRAPDERALETYGRRLQEARSRKRRADGEALSLWTALIDGRASVAPRGTGAKARYVVLDNPPATRAMHALTEGETAVLTLAARGLSTKLVAYALGLSSSLVSTRLASAAAKVGVFSRAELVRLAALLTPDPRADLPDRALSSAERDVLELLQLGLSNQEIAKRRSRSIRTIANQVSSLLRKTKSTSRRALIVA